MDIYFNLKIFSLKWKVFVPKEWVRFFIIFGVVTTSVAVAYWGSTRILELFLFLIVGVYTILLLTNQINLGFILLLVSAAFVPFSGPGGLNAAVLAVIVLVGLWFLNMLVVKKEFRFIQSSVLLPVSLFLIISVLAFGMGQIPWFIFAQQAPLDAQFGGFAIFFLSAGILILTAHLVQTEVWLKVIVWTFIGIGASYILGRVLNIPQIDRFYQRGLTAGSMFWTWLVALAFSQAVFNTKLIKRYRILLFILVLLTFYVAYFQANDWKSGWVPPLVTVAVVLGLRYKRMAILAIPIVVIAIAYLTGTLIASDEYSWGTRVDAWFIVLEISRVNPILGLGFSNYYWYTPLFPIRGWQVNFNSHSQFVDLIAQVGILGLLCFFWIFWEVGKLSWKLSGELKDGFSRSYAYGVFAGLVGSLMAAFLVDWILPFVYNIGLPGFRASFLFWMFAGGLVSLERIHFGSIKTVGLRGVDE